MRSLVRISFFFVLLSLSGCSKHPDIHYKVIDMTLSNSNNVGAKPVDSGTDSVPKIAYAIKVNRTMQLTSVPPEYPGESRYTNDDELSSMNIYCLSNFDGTHLAGSSLNDYFLTGLGSKATIANFVAAKHFGNGRSYSEDIVQTWDDFQYLYLMTAPALTGNYSFVVDVGMSDNRHFIDTVTVKLY